MNSYDLAVAYRICPALPKAAPDWFNGDKFTMARVALESFKASLGNLRVKLYVLLDNCPPEYAGLFSNLWKEEELELIPLNGIGNRGTFLKQIEILCSQNHSENVYLAEDDYLYLPDQFPALLDALTRPDIDFVTPYDHPDYYELPVHRHRQRTFGQNGRIWKTVRTTTCTFLTTRTTLQNTRAVFETYYSPTLFNKMTDNAIWIALTKHRIYNPLNLLYYAVVHPFWGWGFFCAWVNCRRHILRGKTYRLWTCTPSPSTHLERTCLAAGTDWAGKTGELHHAPAEPA
jgi:hypothetical protein